MHRPRLDRIAERSFHGVTRLTCPELRSRKSFAAYYYTKEPPAHWDGSAHSTIFRARPDEIVKGRIAMPLEAGLKSIRGCWTGLKSRVKSTLRRGDR